MKNVISYLLLFLSLALVGCNPLGSGEKDASTVNSGFYPGLTSTDTNTGNGTLVWGSGAWGNGTWGP